MTTTASPATDNGKILTLPAARIGQRYGDLRVVRPALEASMLRSIRRYGQLSPVVVRRVGDDRYDLVDGFKRYRACGEAGISNLVARVVEMGDRAAKAAILHLNWAASPVGEMEEAMVVRSLHRDDGLAQLDIAILLGRHKSWVSRRISLIERLEEAVREEIKLGLISASIGRELAKLPRGNQVEALAAIRKHALDCRETARLVRELLTKPRWNHAAILRCRAILEEREPKPPRGPKVDLTKAAVYLRRDLSSLVRICQTITSHRTEDTMADVNEDDAEELDLLMRHAVMCANQTAKWLERAVSIAENLPEKIKA
jgi:ParB/RepB/Spo0J family partition protein